MNISCTSVIFSALLAVTTTPVDAQSYFGDQNCGVVAAARRTIGEARSWIHANGHQDYARVFRSTNNWFAITVGVVERSKSDAIIQEGVRRATIPSDSYCTTGSKFLEEINWGSTSAQAQSEPFTGLWEPFDARPLSVEEKRFLQAGLALGGYYTGLLDGVWGNGSQSSLEAYARDQFDREPHNVDAAFLASSFMISINDDGWSEEAMEGLAMQVMLPTKKMRVVEAEGVHKTWEHSTKEVSLIANDLTSSMLIESHEYVESKAYRSEDLYKVRTKDMWVTTAYNSSFTTYLRSDLIRGTWSTIFIVADGSGYGTLNLIASSISQGYMGNFWPNQQGVLMRQVNALMDELNEKPDEGPNPSEVGVSREPIRSPSEPEEPRGGGTGTGFLINEDGVLLTNAHVVEECSSINVNGHRADLLVSSNIFDLAAVSVPNADLGEPLKFASEAAGLNADITIAGYPLHGLLGGLNVSRGSISALKGLRGDETNLQISAPVQPGNSGGPAVNRFGNVVGVVVSKLDTVEIADLTGDIAQNINFAVRGDLAKVFLSSNGISYSETSGDEVLGGEEVAQRLQASTHLIECAR